MNFLKKRSNKMEKQTINSYDDKSNISQSPNWKKLTVYRLQQRHYIFRQHIQIFLMIYVF
jgi:hypothetical protein